jgi:hypothetical protein
MRQFTITTTFLVALATFVGANEDKDTKATASVGTDGETLKFDNSERAGDTTHMVIDGEGRLSEDNSAPLANQKRLTRTAKKSKAAPEKESVPAPEEESVPAMAAASPNKGKQIVQDDAPRKYNMPKLTGTTNEDEDLDEDVALDELEALTIEGALLRKHFSPPPPVNCKWGEWTKETSCSQTCGGGMQPWTRKIATKNAWGGKACEGKDNKISKCDNDVCPTTAAPTPAPTTTPAFASRRSSFSLLVLSALWLAGQ